MSTRATYQIKSGFSTATLYIHHDGYPARRCSILYETDFRPNAYQTDRELTEPAFLGKQSARKLLVATKFTW